MSIQNRSVSHMSKYIKRIKKDYNMCCYYGNCKENATHGFKSKLGRTQRAKYCYTHVKEIKQNGQFPNCEIISIQIFRNCEYCGKDFVTIYPSGKFCCREHKEYNHQYRVFHPNPEWQRRAKLRLCTRMYKEELGNKCQLCGATGKLELHHKDYNSTAKENCELLCRKCHRQVRHGLKG